MFESIQGILKEKEPSKAIIETTGIGYRVSIPLSTYSRLPLLNTSVLLYLSQVIREDAHTLYAFIAKEERDLFEVLITLSGIGPKTAVAIIGHMDMTSFHHAIISSDLRILGKIPGIGKKTAERLVIEMRDKFKNLPKQGKGASLAISPMDPLLADAIAALMNLGYNPLEAQKAVQKAKEETSGALDLGTLITTALKKF